MTAHNAKSQHLHVSDALATAQPWVRDHYSTLRAEAGPRLEHAKTVVVPVIADTTTRVREDYLPAAAQATSQFAHQAARRTAPYRAELATRSAAAFAAARGEVTADDLARLQRRGRGRKAKIVGFAALLGAAASAGVVVWQRSHQKQWDQDDLTETALDESAAKNNRTGPANDPARPAGETATESSIRSGSNHSHGI
jgi:Family of unknown function (DUF5324)